MNKIFTRYDKSDKTAFFKIATHHYQNPNMFHIFAPQKQRKSFHKI
ncbi:hypothetical protein KVM65_00380 [Helicobacter pylori]|nr:hypothetical protein KVM65_00380 [Helicobacter pylori]